MRREQGQEPLPCTAHTSYLGVQVLKALEQGEEHKVDSLGLGERPTLVLYEPGY